MNDVPADRNMGVRTKKSIGLANQKQAKWI